MAKRTIISKEDLFNKVAPIHIYLNENVLYEKEARLAFGALKKIKKDKLVISCFGDNAFVFNERSVKNVDEKVFLRIYNQLFEELVAEVFPTWKADNDYFGAKCFKVDGLILLEGDTYDCFPLYADVETLMERLIDLKQVV